MLHDMIQMSYLVIVADVTLMLFILFNSTLPWKKRAIFLLAAAIALLMVVCNIVMYRYENTGTHLKTLRFFTAVSYAVSGPVVIPFIFLSSVISKHIQRLIQAFATGNILLSFSSIWTGWIFSYDADGHLSLGMFSPIPFYLSGMYLAVLLAASVIKFRMGFRTESVFITVLSICIISAVVMNTAFGYKFLISGMAVLSTVFYYLFFTTQTLTRDAMTNALNRHSFYKDIESMKKQQMFLISMDLNGLKQINDTLGHDAGDKAIITVAETALEILPMKCRFYRMGGDEFEILCPNMQAEEIHAMVQAIKEAVRSKQYSVAIGYGAYQKGMDFDTVFKSVDAMMYADKASMKAN